MPKGRLVMPSFWHDSLHLNPNAKFTVKGHCWSIKVNSELGPIIQTCWCSWFEGIREFD
jgi:hypothetical protein